MKHKPVYPVVLLSDLNDGDRFILKRANLKYLLKTKKGNYYTVKPIGHTVGLTRFDGSFHRIPIKLHKNCHVTQI